MNKLPAFPPEVHRYVAQIFRAANRRVCEKVALVPNCSEPSLDLTLIEHLSQFAGPRLVAPGWAVRLDIHYLGGLRHFYGWEVADIGVLVFAKQGSSVVAKKTALLQSKRLYPSNGGIAEESPEDYQIGFGGLLPSPGSAKSLALAHSFLFKTTSKYKALKVADGQYKAIESYEAKNKLDVHYLLYNPWVLDASYAYPVAGAVKLGKAGNGGCRVVSASTLRAGLQSKPSGYSPSFSEVAGIAGGAAGGQAGWRLYHFISDLLLRCNEGNLFE
ncbi:MAG: hypothetical protein KDA57_22845, partial [Planctomycetales bacterium]|nr:hypothetical protein [Planctomycetales bacterium]